MALLLREMFNLYKYLNEDLKDPRTQGLPLIGNPFPVLGLLVLYNVFVQHWGPQFMANRKPFNLDRVIIIYNIFQIVVCSWLFLEAFRLCWAVDYSFLCQPVDYSVTPRNTQLILRVYLFFWLKITDLLDTVFFVLRKKMNQISFLHIYHHTGMVCVAWSAVKWMPGGHDVFVGWINCLVHAVMYSYYLLTTLKPEYKANIWWKKYITQLQMVQFLMFMVHSLLLLLVPDCGYPKFTVAFFVPQNFFMLLLFSDFYKNSYMKKGVMKR